LDAKDIEVKSDRK